MTERWYRADFEAEIDGLKYNPDSEYFVADDDEAAIKYAKRLACEGWNYLDNCHVDCELVKVTLVDNENEMNDIKTNWE